VGDFAVFLFHGDICILNFGEDKSYILPEVPFFYYFRQNINLILGVND